LEKKGPALPLSSPSGGGPAHYLDRKEKEEGKEEEEKNNVN